MTDLESFKRTQVLLAALPQLPAILLTAQQALLDRLSEKVFEDADTVVNNGAAPHLENLADDFPELWDFLQEDLSAKELRGSQLCQFAADLYALAARELWEVE